MDSGRRVWYRYCLGKCTIVLHCICICIASINPLDTTLIHREITIRKHLVIGIELTVNSGLTAVEIMGTGSVVE